VVSSQWTPFGYAPPTIGNVVNTVQSDLTALKCPVIDAATGVAIPPTEVRDVFALSLRGFNFGPARADGMGPKPAAAPGSARARSSVAVRATFLIPGRGAVPSEISCFEEWGHDVIRLVVPYPGNVSVITTSVAWDGSTIVQASNAVSFEQNSPSLRTNSKDTVLPSVPANGTGVVRIVGRFLFDAGSVTASTRVTIGGTSGGFAIPEANVVLGTLTPANGARLLANEPDQYLDITVPPWQGERVPLLVFKLLSSTTTAGSDPYYITIEAPRVARVMGQGGVEPAQFQPVRARTNGTTRVRMEGPGIGFNFTSIIFLNTPLTLSQVAGGFTDCARGVGFIECTAPAGVGAEDDGDVARGIPPAALRIALRQGGMQCDPQAQAANPGWDQCVIVEDPTQTDVVPEQGVAFAYEPPQVLGTSGILPATGGVLHVWGYGFGAALSQLRVWLDPRSGSSQSRIDVPVTPGSLTVDPESGVQSFEVQVQPGVGANWTVGLNVKGQLVNSTSAVLQFSFERPVLQSLSVATGVTSGGYNITLTGQNFGPVRLAGLVR
jgi:hypothetical protein